MDKIKAPKTLSKQEKDFCELYIFGCDPYAGNARKCYEELFDGKGNTSRAKAQDLLERDDVKEYLDKLQMIAGYKTSEMKARLTEKLLRIIDETSTSRYTDRRGTVLSPAPLRSVAVQATKALMEMYPVKVAQESKVEFSGGDGTTGVTFNVIMPEQKKQEGE